ncbi:MAG: hypothetical protein BMS9Abin12_1174 [Acidimicrobiia bacterium]|nr:MAG: hypothetical protein BMS9Abin12_1174 [Acidimicrobiia bacterium]
MDDLIRDIQERTGLSADKVLEVVTMVADYMKNALPEDLVSQIVSYLGEAVSDPQTTASKTATAASSFATLAAETAATAAATVLGAVTEILPTPEDD